MATKIETFLKPFLKGNLPELRAGDIVQVYQKIPGRLTGQRGAGEKEGDKERTQTFEGLIIARKRSREIGSTITVRKVISGIGVERIFPLYSPTIEKIEVLKRGRVRRAKLYYLRKVRGKKAKLEKKEFVEVVDEEKSGEEIGE